jgi:hypothetical protein
VKLTAGEPVAKQHRCGDPLGRHRLRHRRVLVGQQLDATDVPASVSKVRFKGNIDWTFGGSGYRHI